MRMIKKLIPLFICLMMIATLGVSVFAADSQANIYGELTATQVEVGDEFTFTLYNNEMTAQAFKAGFYFDNTKLEVTKISFKDIMCYSEDDEDYVEADLLSKTTKAKANTDGSALGVYTFNSGIDSLCEEGEVVVVNFKAIAEGEATITLREETLGTDAFKSDSVETLTVTIGSSAPASDCDYFTPHEITLPYTSEDLAIELEENWDHYYVWKAPANGKLTIVVPDGLCCDTFVNDDENVDGEDTTLTLNVQKDDVVVLNVYNVYAVNGQWSVSFCDHSDTTKYTYDSNKNGTHKVVCECGETVNEAEDCSGGTANCAAPAQCSVCKGYYGAQDPNVHAFGSHYVYEKGGTTHTEVCNVCSKPLADPEAHDQVKLVSPGKCNYPAVYQCSKCTAQPVYGEYDMTNHAASSPSYKKNEDGSTHTVYWPCCQTPVDTAVPHDYTYDATNHKCVCGEVEKFELHVEGSQGSWYSEQVLFGANIEDIIYTWIDEGKLNISPYYENYDDETFIQIGLIEFKQWVNLADGKPVGSDSKVTGNMDISHESLFTGWIAVDGKWQYQVNSVAVSGWTQINHSDYLENGEGSDWYYFDPKTHIRAEGISRAPYNTELGHGPNADDKAYWEANNTSKYTDAETAVYVFGEDGKLNRTTGIVNDKGTTRYAVDGVIAWHPGFVTVDNMLYYFVADTSDAKMGNIAADGIVYVTRGTGDDTYKPGYVIFKNGQVDDSSDISLMAVTNSQGVTNHFYFEYGVCVPGKGLVKFYDLGYIYVRSGGQIVENADYYIPVNDLGIVSGLYHFNNYGIMQNPKSTDVNGIVDGYYYKDGKLNYAGLIEIDGETYYIKSNGQVATGTYYVTKVSNYNGDLDIKSGDKLVFDDEGKLQPIKNGIVEENDVLYYYENNRIVYGAGVVELTDDAGATFYIYVRSNGQLATGKYWPTTRNGYLVSGEYDWGTDGRYYPAD